METLTKRMGGDDRLKLAHQLGVAADRKLSLDPVLHGGQAALFQARNLSLTAGLQGHISQRRPAPQLQRPPQQSRGPRRIAGGKRSPALLGQALEASKVQIVGA